MSADMRHLEEEELVEVLEGLADGRMAHVDSCPACRARTEEVREAWRLAEDADVPEPSPLYWEAFRRQVDRRLDGEGRPVPRLRLAGALAAAAVLAGIVSLAPWRGEAPVPAIGSAGAPVAGNGSALPVTMLPAWSALPEPQEDPGLPVLQAIAAAGDLAVAPECGIDECLASLSEDESRALADVLQEALPGRKS